MSKHITVTLLNGTKTEYTYVDITTVHDGVLSIELGRDNWVTYPLTSILKWEARHV